MHGLRPNLVLGIAVALLAAAALFVWVPLDTDSGLIEKVRRRVQIGDALAPTVALGFVLLGALLLLAFERNRRDQPGLSWSNLGYLGLLLATFVLALAAMRWLGPLSVALFAAEDQSYRLLRATAPWKYLGYVIGGATLIALLITWIERRLSLRALAIGLSAALLLALLYDLPFEDLLLPPNGDV